MNEVTVFTFNQSQVRTIIDADGNPLFCGKDVCDILGHTNASNTMAKHCKGVSKRYPLQTAGGVQEVRFLTEPDLYRLIVGSQLPAAQEFEKWVFEEVLPTIRKTGRYETYSIPHPPTPTELAQRDFIALKKVAEAFGLTHNRALISANIALRKRTGIDFQAELDVKLIAEDNSNYLLATEIGERLGLGTGRKAARHANLLLAEEGFQFKNERNEWRPTEKGRAYAVILDTGKAHHDGSMVQQLRWKESIVSMLQSCVKQHWKINNL